MLTVNKDYLHIGSELGEKPMGGPYKKMYLVNREGHVAIWEVLDHDPWLNQIQRIPQKEI